MAYIPNSDISQDMLAAQFSSSFSTYHTLVDDHINELAEGEQLDSTDIETDSGTGYISSKFLRRYCKYWVCMMLFLDKMGMNDNTLANEEKYLVKYKFYKEKVDEMQPRISYEMFTNNIVSRMHTSSSRNLYRG